MSELIQKSYYAIIPANVRYDKDLTPNAKLLYGEITALCNEHGYCWASNNYFSELYGVSKATISALINSLVKLNYLRSETIYKTGTKQVDKRLLFINYPIQNNLNTCSNNHEYPIQNILNTPIQKNLKDNITYINNTSNNTFINKSIDENSENSNFDLNQNSERKKVAPKKESFKIPSVEEIRAYCVERSNNIDAQKFFDFYQSKGWYVGKNKMKDWKAAVRTWESSNKTSTANPSLNNPGFTINR